MHLLADKSVDQPVVERLHADGHEVVAIAEMEPSMADEAVLTMANQRRAVLLTADKDFGELVFRQGRIAAGVLLLRLAGLSPATKATMVSAVVREHGSELPEAFTMVSPGMLRIRRRM
jgi:predicted nuclease of predicted toxin-antitoxin system